MIVNLLRKIWIFIKIKKIWKKPKKAKILIYDHHLAFYFEEYIKEKNYQIYYNRFENTSELNLFVILKCLVNFDIKFKKYKKFYFYYVDPKIVITMDDNNSGFFKLKKEFPNLITIAIQKAWKYDTEIDIIYQRHKKKKENLDYSCDYLFCYNKIIAQLFSQFIKAKKIYNIGSFMSNSQKISNFKKDYIVYISQWRNYEKSTKYHKDLTFGDWQKNEEFFLKKLSFFIRKNSYNLKVLGKLAGNSGKNEKIFYDKIFGSHYEFIFQNDSRDKYKTLDSAKLTISLESTLGYENLARGNKTIFFSIRNDKKLNFDCIRFCWPEHKSETGPNWTNLSTYSEFKRLFALIDLSDDNWKKIIKINFKDTLQFDTNNSKFVNLLNKLSKYENKNT